MALHDKFTLLPSSDTLLLLISEMSGLPNIRNIMHIQQCIMLLFTSSPKDEGAFNSAYSQCKGKIQTWKTFLKIVYSLYSKIIM